MTAPDGTLLGRPDAGMPDPARANGLPLLELRPERLPDRIRHALQDIGGAAKLWRLCLKLAWLDIKLRYRGSILGPFWLTASTAVMIGAMSVLYTTLFKTDITAYMPFLSLSLVLWGFIGGMVNEGTVCFTGSENLIRSMRVPFTLFAVRTLTRNILVLLHNVVVVVGVFLVFRVWPGAVAFKALPAAGLWVLDAVAVCLLLGTLGARYRDIPPIIASLMQIFFFISPIIWKPDLITHGHRWLQLNPFYPLLEILRRPLLGQHGALHLWYWALGDSALLWLAAFAVFMRARARLAYWI